MFSPNPVRREGAGVLGGDCHPRTTEVPCPGLTGECAMAHVPTKRHHVRKVVLPSLNMGTQVSPRRLEAAFTKRPPPLSWVCVEHAGAGVGGAAAALVTRRTNCPTRIW